MAIEDDYFEAKREGLKYYTLHFISVRGKRCHAVLPARTPEDAHRFFWKYFGPDSEEAQEKDHEIPLIITHTYLGYPKGTAHDADMEMLIPKPQKIAIDDAPYAGDLDSETKTEEFQTLLHDICTQYADLIEQEGHRPQDVMSHLIVCLMSSLQGWFLEQETMTHWNPLTPAIKTTRDNFCKEVTWQDQDEIL